MEWKTRVIIGLIFFNIPPQENFRKGAFGLLHIAEIGGADAVSAVAKLEEDNDIKTTIFRGAENLIPPDVRTLLFWVLFLEGIERESRSHC